MKRLHEAVSEIDRLSKQPLDEEGLVSLLASVHEVALHGNAGLTHLVSRLFPQQP